jgi:hypothetical protein
VGDEKEPFGPGEEPPEADDRLRERVAAARGSIGDALREAVERLEHAERAALGAAEDRLGRLAAERVDDALVRLGVEHGQHQAELERRLERAIESLASEVGERFGRASAQLEEVAGRYVAGGADARAERDQVERASERAVGAIREAESRALRFVSDATDTLTTTQRQAEATAARIEEAMARVEGAIVEVVEAERRVQDIQQRAERMEGRVTEAVQTAARAADWESRMADAARIEAEAARRISDAERRILGSTEEPGDPPPSRGLS